MRAGPARHIAKALMVTALLPLLGGCAMFGGSNGEAPTTQPATQPSATNDEGDTESPSVMDSARTTAERLAEAMSRSGPGQSSQPRSNRAAATQPQRVQWRDAAQRSRPRATQSDPPSRDATAQRDADEGEEPADEGAADAAATQPDETTLADFSKQALVEELIRRTREGEAGPVRQAIAGVGLSLFNNQASLPGSLLTALNTPQREQIKRFHDLAVTLASDLLTTDHRLTREAVRQHLDMLFREEPVTIRAVDLCRSVQGFGVYKPFEDHRFLSGETQKMIVYAELDHFTPTQVEDRFEVKLKQEVVLFNQSDGLAVWSHEPVSIMDRSRNKRQDFFTVQLIELPQRLNVGKYRLKVRVTDVHGGSVDETTIPLELVADSAIARGEKQVK